MKRKTIKTPCDVASKDVFITITLLSVHPLHSAPDDVIGRFSCDKQNECPSIGKCPFIDEDRLYSLL